MRASLGKEVRWGNPRPMFRILSMARCRPNVGILSLTSSLLELLMPSPTAVDPSVLSALQTIREHYPNVPFLALGQTVLWDEPTKAVWRHLLDSHLPGATLVAGVHDTDYFAKTSAHVADDQPYVALPHDDGKTRDLWSAAGELSALLGSESVPTRAMFLKANVPFDWLGKSYPGGKSQLYADKTAAWGWRGIVHTESHSVIAHDIPILDIQDALLEQLDWGFAESIACLADAETRVHAQEVAAQVRGWVLEFLENCDDSCRLSDLYQTLLPRFYALLLGEPAQNLQTTSSVSLFRFNRQTCTLPRFDLIGLFLDPETRPIAREAYSKSVAGLGMYPLDAFGPGAIPFDLVIPGVGRGTIRTTPAALVIETAPQETFVPLRERITTLGQLAAVTEERFGPDVALVGKAVTLADMIATEFLVVFHETASGYTSATQAMNAHLARHGLSQRLYPIVRLTYPTWDALASAPPEAAFRLPPHFAATFEAETIIVRDFAARWRGVIASCRQVLRESRDLSSPRRLLTFLEGRHDLCWCERREEYDRAQKTLKEIAAHSDTLRGRIEEHRREMAVWQRERLDLERRKGEDWRNNIQPLLRKLNGGAEAREATSWRKELNRQMAIRASAFDAPINVARERIAATRFLLAEFRRQRRLLERGPEANAARARMTEIVREAQMARLDLVRNAYLTIESLEHTQLRPTAWWLPLVDPTGAWFEAMAAGTQARLEALA